MASLNTFPGVPGAVSRFVSRSCIMRHVLRTRYAQVCEITSDSLSLSITDQFNLNNGSGKLTTRQDLEICGPPRFFLPRGTPYLSVLRSFAASEPRGMQLRGKPVGIRAKMLSLRNAAGAPIPWSDAVRHHPSYSATYVISNPPARRVEQPLPPPLSGWHPV